MNNDKKSYEAPKLIVHGNVEEVTQMTKVGGALDRAFPNNTPLSDLTVS